MVVQASGRELSSPSECGVGCVFSRSCCPELCAASTDGPLGQARAVAGRIPKELRTRAAPEDPGEAERHGLCWRDLRARPNKAGPMTPDEERRAREVRGRSIRNKRPLARLEPRIFVF